MQLAFAPDNKTLYASGFNTYLRSWDVAGGKELTKLGPMPDSIFGMSISGDGTMVATAGHDGSLRLWDVKTGKAKLVQLQTGKKASLATYCLAFTPNATAVVTGHDAGIAAMVTPLDKFTTGDEKKGADKKKKGKG